MINNNHIYGKNPFLVPKAYTAYASIDLTISGAQTDYSLKDNTDLFSKLTSGYEISLMNGSDSFVFKLNSDVNDPIPYISGSMFGIMGFIVTDVLITTSGDLTINIFSMGWR